MKLVPAGASMSRRRFIFSAARSSVGLCALAAVGAVFSGCSPAAQSAQSGSGLEEVGEKGSSAGSGERSGTTQLTSTFFAFDTVITLVASCSEELFQQVIDRCAFFENTFSRTIEGSDIWAVNHADGAVVQVQPETADIIAQALGYAAESDGRFDITIGAVSELWDFDNAIKPDDAAIQEAVTHVDYTKVLVDTAACTVQLEDPLAALDLGGIAKGYIADDLTRILREGGCESACINLGGNVYALGMKPDGTPWNVGIQDPNNTETHAADEVIASIAVTDGSVVTSGLYERQFEQDGVVYYHILDPKTGYPAETDLVASSVVSARSVDGDAYATILFLLGHDAALEFVENHEGLEALLVNDSGKRTCSQGSHFTLW